MRTRYSLGEIVKYEAAPIDKHMVLAELEKYLLYHRRLSRQNTTAIVRGARYLIEHYGVTRPCEDDALRIWEDMHSRGIKNSTIRLRLYDLEYLAESMGIQGANGERFKVRKPKKTTELAPMALSQVEARQLIEAACNLRDKAIITTLLYTGLRNKELCNLRTWDVDLDKHLLYVRDHGMGVKNHHERAAVLTRECADTIHDWLTHRPCTGNDYLYITMYGDKITQARLEKIIRDTARRAGLTKRVYPHLLRHTCASTLLRNGVPLTDVMLQLGHHSLQSTMIYLHGDLETLHDNINNFEY